MESCKSAEGHGEDDRYLSVVAWCESVESARSSQDSSASDVRREPPSTTYQPEKDISKLEKTALWPKIVQASKSCVSTLVQSASLSPDYAYQESLAGEVPR